MQFNVLLKMFLTNLRGKNFKWIKITSCDKTKNFTNSSYLICRRLVEECKYGTLTKRELAFCLRIEKDKANLRDPKDLEDILFHIIRNDLATEIAVAVDKRGREKVFILGNCDYISLPPRFSSQWIFIVNFLQYPEILTAFPLASKHPPLENYLNHLLARKDANALEEILLFPISLKELILELPIVEVKRNKKMLKIK